MKPRNFHSTMAVAIGVLALGAAAPATADEPIKIGFVTHAQGNPFIQQIVDGAQAAAKDLGVELVVSQESGGDPEGQLKAVQNFVNSGVAGRRHLRARRVDGERPQRDHRQRRSDRPVQSAQRLGECALCRREIDAERAHPRQGDRRQARRRRRQGHRHHRQLLPRLPGARKSRQGRRGVAEGGAGPQGARAVRREGQRGRQLQSLGAALRRQSGRRGADRPLRARRRQPRQAQCRQRRQVRGRRLRPDRATTSRPSRTAMPM